MSITVGDYIVQRLKDWGVPHVYGFPGDGINGLLGSFERHQDLVRFIQVRHEEMAAFMACAHAKWTGEVGVCCATSGPGAIHLLNGLYDAKQDHQPVVAIVGQTYARAMGGQFQQEVDLLNLYKDVAGAYVQQCDTPEAARHIIDRAIRIAQAERTVTAVIFPADVQDMEAVPAPPHATHTIHSGIGWAEPRVIPRESDLRQAADVLNAGRKVAMLVGAGALHATDEVLAAAEILGAGVAKALLGKAAVPDDVPFCTNSIGLLGTKPSWDMMQDCDTLFMVGTAFPYGEFLPEEGKAKAVQIDIKGRQQSIRYPVDVLLTGDSRETLRELMPLLRRKEDRSWQGSITDAVADWWKLMDERGKPELTSRGKLRPEALFSAASRKLPDHAILAADSGSAANWYARNIRIRRGMKASLSGNLATMLPGVPYAIAAKFAYPDRPAIGMIGDGAMQMLGMNELLTVAKHYREWSDKRLIFLVLNNEDLNQVTWEQRVLAGDPKFETSQKVPPMNYAAFAESIGLRGIRVERPEEVGPAWDQALASDRPVVIDAVVDPDEPPLPPHITFEQATNFAKSIVREPHGVGIATDALKEKIGEVLPH
ncbi:MAG TPA: thiamine pyrophosphate-requiring protein [Candidatus Dormibacteraeota bacterium]|jgi:pyruvate dehydrogenase (quinone)|nr:thiamine pyrophosphate-requiring protein [Candidatus Dormibacteraeota bacterium]